MIVGDDDSERIEGTGGDDVIVGRGGGDIITGGEGNDVICGRMTEATRSTVAPVTTACSARTGPDFITELTGTTSFAGGRLRQSELR